MAILIPKLCVRCNADSGANEFIGMGANPVWYCPDCQKEIQFLRTSETEISRASLLIK